MASYPSRKTSSCGSESASEGAPEAPAGGGECESGVRPRSSAPTAAAVGCTVPKPFQPGCSSAGTEVTSFCTAHATPLASRRSNAPVPTSTSGFCAPASTSQKGCVPFASSSSCATESPRCSYS